MPPRVIQVSSTMPIATRQTAAGQDWHGRGRAKARHAAMFTASLPCSIDSPIVAALRTTFRMSVGNEPGSRWCDIGARRHRSDCSHPG